MICSWIVPVSSAQREGTPAAISALASAVSCSASLVCSSALPGASACTSKSSSLVARAQPEATRTASAAAGVKSVPQRIVMTWAPRP